MQQREEDKNKRNNKTNNNSMMQDLEDLLAPSTMIEIYPKQAEGKNETTPTTFLIRTPLSSSGDWEGLRKWGNTRLKGMR